MSMLLIRSKVVDISLEVELVDCANVIHVLAMRYLTREKMQAGGIKTLAVLLGDESVLDQGGGVVDPVIEIESGKF